MTEAESTELARNWWTEVRSGEFGDAHCELNDLIQAGEPDVIGVLAALAQQATDEELAFLGAGPFEDVLSHSGRGAAYAERLVELARRAPRVRAAVRCVWLSDDVPPIVRDLFLPLGATDIHG